MKKTLYSLMLSDDIMREVDALAHRMGTNRSNLVNMILAERVKMRTPEQQLRDIFSDIERLLSATGELIPMAAPSAQRVAVRSSLAYKYRPTLRYEVELADEFRPGEMIGTLTVIFRTQSEGLLELLNRFFRCFCRIEEQLLPQPNPCVLDSGRFLRPLMYPVRKNGLTTAHPLRAEELSGAITDYVRLVDRMLKACVGGADAQTLAELYADDLNTRSLIL